MQTINSTLFDQIYYAIKNDIKKIKNLLVLVMNKELDKLSGLVLNQKDNSNMPKK